MPRSPARRRVLLHESDFAEALGVRGHELMLQANILLASGASTWGERRYDQFHILATGLESFLDDHGARANQAFFRLRETVAVQRWLSLAASALAHLDGRLGSYPLRPEGWAEEMLRSPLQEALGRLDGYLRTAAQVLRKEWVRAGAVWAEDATEGVLNEALASLSLPADRDQDDPGAEMVEAHSAAARFASRYQRLTQAWTPGARRRVSGLKELRAFMEAYCSESIARRFEARAHNLQSEFDSEVAGTAEAQEYPQLLALRSSVSLSLHLLEAGTALTHLYERHDLHERHGESRELFDTLVSTEELLDIVANTCVVGAYECLAAGAPLAEEMISQLTSQVEREFVLPEGVQMHARPISLIVRVTSHHGTPVEMVVDGETASAASMMALLVLVGARPQQRSFGFRGDSAVLEDLEVLFAAGLGENGLDELPAQLGYLRS
jgi:phosphotransferase system HPr-like phosphotransfer protein